MRAFVLSYPDETLVQEVLAHITWYHHITLFEKVKDEQARLWYIQQAIAQGWSRNVLVMQVETGLYHRRGKALTNFQATLPALQSDLAQAVLNDPYVFDFITTSEETQERHIQQALLAHIQRFLLELGVGFAFVGSGCFRGPANEEKEPQSLLVAALSIFAYNLSFIAGMIAEDDDKYNGVVEDGMEVRDSLLGRQVVARSPLAWHNQPSQAD